MNRPKLNFIIDAVAFAGVVFLMATGFLLRYGLPPGSGGLGAGRGAGAAERPVALLWGLTRHEWGEIHFWIAVALMAILSVHLILHWRWIVCMVKGQKPEASGVRLAFGILALTCLLAAAAAPFCSRTEYVRRGDLYGVRIK
ncbi:MAG: DUF4405 domain-containing protein [Candidatus Omnitrophica bacterium]|nr:DUF4405 domain-containing protein [Candidatus Omnitrophota bacterium]